MEMQRGPEWVEGPELNKGVFDLWLLDFSCKTLQVLCLLVWRNGEEYIWRENVCQMLPNCRQSPFGDKLSKKSSVTMGRFFTSARKRHTASFQDVSPEQRQLVHFHKTRGWRWREKETWRMRAERSSVLKWWPQRSGGFFSDVEQS